MKPEPIVRAIDAVSAMYEEQGDAPPLRVYLSPEGEVWNQKLVEEIAQQPSLLILCGHYEGVDERVRELRIDREFSMGDYVVTGGELPAMLLIDSVSRLVPGVIGNADSVLRDSFSGGGLLDFPHYTRPEEFEGKRVPETLIGGHHAKVEAWRRQQSLARTLKRRPELIERNADTLDAADRKFLDQLRDEPSD